MFAEPASTRLDLRFELAGVRVRVHPMFWLVAALLGLRLPIAEQALFVSVVFVSVLTHEMGHALGGRAIGQRPHVVLHSLGGSTVSEATVEEESGWQRGLVTLAGPLANGLLVLAALAMSLEGSTRSGLPGAVRFHLLWVNVVWSLFNLLPIIPLDGGWAMQRFLTSIGGETGYASSSIVSFVTVGIVALLAWRMSQPFLALYMVYFAVKTWEQSF